MAYPAGAPLPSSKIILIILDVGIFEGIIPMYLENKSLSISFVKIISLFLEKFSTMENLIGVIAVDNQNFSIKINYLKERNLILSGNFICKKEFRIPANGQLGVLNTSMMLTLNGNIQAIVLGNNGNDNFYKTIKISIENGKIISDVSNFTLYVF